LDKIIEKISSFNIFTNLLPGAIFCFLLNRFSSLSLPNGKNVYDYLVFYFVGVVISRVGSIVIEPIFKRLKIVKYAPLNKYIKAEKEDSKIQVLLETNNFYRSMISMLFLFGLALFYNYVESIWSIAPVIVLPLLAISLIVLFALSYRKQTSFIYNRVISYDETEQNGKT